MAATAAKARKARSKTGPPAKSEPPAVKPALPVTRSAASELELVRQAVMQPFDTPATKQIAAQLLAAGVAPRKIADKLGISLTSFLVWAQNDPAFGVTVDQYLHGLKTSVVLSALDKGNDMIHELADMAADKAISPADRRAAALEVLKHGGVTPAPAAVQSPGVNVNIDQRKVVFQQRLQQVVARAMGENTIEGSSDE